jgi:integrase
MFSGTLYEALSARALRTFTTRDLRHLGLGDTDAISELMRREVGAGRLKATEKLKLPNGLTPLKIYTLEEENPRGEYEAYLLKALGEQKRITSAYLKLKDGGILSEDDLRSEYLMSDRSLKVFRCFEAAGLMTSRIRDDMRIFYCPGVDRVLLEGRLSQVAYRQRKKRIGGRFKTVTDMLQHGYCRTTRAGPLTPYDPLARIGQPKDDMTLSKEEVGLLLAAVDPEDLRDRLLFNMMFRVGSRVSQVLNVRVQDVDMEKQRVYVKPSKLGMAIYRRLDVEFLEKIREYVVFYGLGPKDFLFSVFYVGGVFSKWITRDRSIDRRTVGEALHNAAAAAGLQYNYLDNLNGLRRRRIHPHISKRSFASWVYAESKDASVTAAAIGNRDVRCVEEHYIKLGGSYEAKVVEDALKGLAI